MKKSLLITFILCFVGLSTNIFAQKEDNTRKERFEKFQKERKEYIAGAMKLTEQEKKEFWTLCDELQMKKFEANKPLREQWRKIRKAKKDKENISEADYRKIIELSLEIKQKEAQLEKEYYGKFFEVISAEKVFLYQKAEQDFGKKIMQKRKKD